MKKLINGKVYNTDTATHLANWNNGLSNRDFEVCNEDLYVTNKGRYFIEGEGGGNSPWAHYNKNSRCEGSGIKVLSKEAALRWCDDHELDIKWTKIFKIEKVEQ